MIDTCGSVLRLRDGIITWRETSGRPGSCRALWPYSYIRLGRRVISKAYLLFNTRGTYRERLQRWTQDHKRQSPMRIAARHLTDTSRTFRRPINETCACTLHSAYIHVPTSSPPSVTDRPAYATKRQSGKARALDSGFLDFYAEARTHTCLDIDCAFTRERCSAG